MPWFMVLLLIAVGCQARDHGGKLLEHLCPAELGAPKRLIDPRLGDVEARVRKGRRALISSLGSFRLGLPFGNFANAFHPVPPSLGHAVTMFGRDQPHPAVEKR